MIPNNQMFFNQSASTSSDIQVWYDSLSVKPSAGLWSDLQTLYDGMVSDGDWVEMDFFSMIACMETNEQRRQGEGGSARRT